jgi:RNA polymerase sigma-70 factor (ECF subfamily)
LSRNIELGSDAAAFADLTEPYRRRLKVHCYRMLGSLEDAEDMVQETMLRAWRHRANFQGRSNFGTWLYQIATNACLNVLRRTPRRVMPPDLGPAAKADPHAELVSSPEIPWLQPFPDRLLQASAPEGSQPDAVVVSRETIQITYLTAIQHLPPRQRAVLILRDALDWSAQETATLLDTTVAAVNSALNRARSTMRAQLGSAALESVPTIAPSEEELAVLQRYMQYHETHDLNGFAALLREDARLIMPPIASWFLGRDAILAMQAPAFDVEVFGHLRGVATGANLQPAVAWYRRPPGEPDFEALAIDVLRIERGDIAEITTFVDAGLFEAFGLPRTIAGG